MPIGASLCWLWQGSASAWATLAGFVVGSALSAPTGERVAWADAPSVTGPWTLAAKIGVVPAVAVQLSGLAAVFVGGFSIERIRFVHSLSQPLLSQPLLSQPLPSQPLSL